MKSSEFKKIVKSAVKEAIQEELKDILFEAFKSPKNTSPIIENTQYNQPQHLTTSQTSQPEVSLAEKRARYSEALNGTQLNFTSNDVQSFVPPQSGDSVNGNLGGGSVSMDQISSLMGK